ncbi:hypothetical protein B0H19DRAFT_1277314 [Mycena capillaripes]|nr:hypothetical protein B0H19DRAFT_1277314 [Mycena capillaripes]
MNKNWGFYACSRTHPITGEEVFDANTFLAANPQEQLHKQNAVWIWCTRVFQDGLEQRSYKPTDLILDSVIPTNAERELFAKSGHPSLQAPFLGRCCALQEGDRVIVVAGEHTGETGYIKILKPIKRMRFAAVVPKDSGNNCEVFTVAVQCLCLHTLVLTCSMSVGDRVGVVGGSAQGSSGWVETISNDDLVSFTPPSELSIKDVPVIEVEMRHVDL